MITRYIYNKNKHRRGEEAILDMRMECNIIRRSKFTKHVQCMVNLIQILNIYTLSEYFKQIVDWGRVGGGGGGGECS